MAEAVTEKNTVIYEVGRFLISILFHTVMPVRYHHAERLDRDPPLLLIANHVHALDPLVIAHGVKKKIKVNKYVACTHCHGSGSEDGSTETCPTCHGRGQVVQTVNSFFGQMQTASVCPTCNGTGKVIKKKCTHCGGEGVMKGDEVIEIDIPAGVGEGMQLTVRGKGNAGPHNGVNGDLLVLI